MSKGLSACSPVYTRPPDFRGMRVPDILLSGNHQLIRLWELWHSVERTLRLRPNLVPKDLTELESSILTAIKKGLTFEDWLEKVGYEKAIRMLKD